MRAFHATLMMLALAVAAPSRADTPRGDLARGAPGADRRIVTFEATRGEGIDAELEAALGELLGRLRLELVRSGAPVKGRIVARVRVESSERGAVLMVESGRPDVAPVRREVDRGDSPALFRETLAHVIFGTVEPLAAFDEGREAPAPPAISPDANKPSSGAPREPVRVSLGGRAGPRLLASDRVGIGFGGVATLTFGGAFRPSMKLEGGYTLPSRLSRGGIDAEFGLVPLRVGAALEPLAWKGGALETGLHGGVDVVWFTPSATSPVVELEAATTRAQPILGAGFAIRFRVASNADVVLGAGLDFDLAPRRWVIAADNGRDPFFETARFRPYAALGLDWAIASSGTPPSGPATSAQREVPDLKARQASFFLR